MLARMNLVAMLWLAVACGGPAPPQAPADSVVTIPAPPDAGAPVAAPSAVSEPAPASTAPLEPVAAPGATARGDRAPRQTGGGLFDRGAAARALSEIDPSICATPGGPRGMGHLTLTFHPSGNVQSVDVGQPFRGTSSGACVASLYATLTIPWFSGGPVTIGKSFVIP